MEENNRFRILSQLQAAFPEYGKKLAGIYRQDPLFRQIAKEFHECVQKQELEINLGRGRLDIYADTINELKEELLEYLREHSPSC